MAAFVLDLTTARYSVLVNALEQYADGLEHAADLERSADLPNHLQVRELLEAAETARALMGEIQAAPASNTGATTS